jgi:hypothetical protein
MDEQQWTARQPIPTPETTDERFRDNPPGRATSETLSAVTP